MTHSETPKSHDIDAVLTAFFQAETPARWPRCPVPESPPKRTAAASKRWWKHSMRQLIVAASVALIFGGYWLLAHNFPKVNSIQNPIDGGLGTGFKIDDANPKTPDDGLQPIPQIISPNGNPVQGWDNGMKDGTFRGVFQGLPELPNAPPALKNSKPPVP